jgi:hypothetical protein
MSGYIHIGRESVQSLIEIVHLHDDTQCDDQPEDVGADMGELVVSLESEFHGNTKAFDGHDAD